MLLDYGTLRVIWWLLLGFLLTGYAVMDGFDLGVAILLPIVSRTDIERRITIDTIAPVWEGNQVWIILGIASLFAAWPPVYAVVFSGFYFAILLLLLSLILRPVGFKYRSKLTNPYWRKMWDVALFIGGFVPALVFGVAVGNVLQGVPYHFDENLRIFYTGTFLELFNPFALFCGVTSVMMLAMHGGYYLSVKTTELVQKRAIKAARVAGLILICLFAAGVFWIAHNINGYQLSHPIVTDGPSNPFYKNVIIQLGAWTKNYYQNPWLLCVPITGFFGAILSIIFVKRGAGKFAFFTSSLSVAGIVASVGVSMFPFILPSSSNPSQSLTVWDASSSQLTLYNMFWAAIIFMPIILLYTAWVYRVLRGKVTKADIEEDKTTMY